MRNLIVSKSNEKNIFAQLRPVVLERLTQAINIDQIVGDLPLDGEYGAKLLNYALIEMGTCGLGAANGVPFETAAALASKTARGITLAFEIVGKDRPRG
jgi:hypothetical protein